MLDRHHTRQSPQVVIQGTGLPLTAFVATKIVETSRVFIATLDKSLRLIPDYVFSRPKDFFNCAAIYAAVAALIAFLQGKGIDARTLCTSALVGGFISPFVIPWVRAFPLTGNPAYKGVVRCVDFSFNLLAHFLSLTAFVWVLKAMIALFYSYMFDLALELPGFFQAGFAFVCINNFRKVATEYLGINVLIFLHPQGHEEISRIATKHPHYNAEQCRLAAWNAWREVGNGYAFWKSTRDHPIGVQYWIVISKTLDSFAILI